MTIDSQLITQLLKHRKFMEKIAEYCDKSEFDPRLSDIEYDINQFLEKNEVVVDLRPLSDKWFKFDKNDKSSWPTGRDVLLYLRKPYRFSFGYCHGADDSDYDFYGFTSSSEDDTYEIELDEITHWRELPDKPEIENE